MIMSTSEIIYLLLLAPGVAVRAVLRRTSPSRHPGQGSGKFKRVIRYVATSLPPVAGLILSMTPAAAGRDERRPLEVIVKSVAEDSLRGDLLSFSTGAGLLLRGDDGHERRISTEDLVRLTTSTSISEPSSTEWEVRLTNGDVLFGRWGESEGDAVTLETVDLGRLTIPLESITACSSPQARSAAQREAFEWFHRGGMVREDMLLLGNGDTARGFVVSVNAEGITLDATHGQVRVPLRLLVAIRFATGVAPPAGKAELRAGVTFKNTGQVTVTDLQWSGRNGSLRMGERDPIRFEAECVVRVDVFGGRWEWLSAHQPISEEHTPMLSLPWGRMVDRNVLGGAIAVAGETYDRGVGVHSRSRLTYDLQGQYGEFVTHFGLDDDSGPHADVTVLIRVDGKPRFEQTGVTRGQLLGPVRLDVAQANRIELVVDFGENGDIQDRFNWVEPALVK